MGGGGEDNSPWYEIEIGHSSFYTGYQGDFGEYGSPSPIGSINKDKLILGNTELIVKELYDEEEPSTDTMFTLNRLVSLNDYIFYISIENETVYELTDLYILNEAYNYCSYVLKPRYTPMFSNHQVGETVSVWISITPPPWAGPVSRRGGLFGSGGRLLN